MLHCRFRRNGETNTKGSLIRDGMYTAKKSSNDRKNSSWYRKRLNWSTGLNLSLHGIPSVKRDGPISPGRWRSMPHLRTTSSKSFLGSLGLGHYHAIPVDQASGLPFRGHYCCHCNPISENDQGQGRMEAAISECDGYLPDHS